MATIIDLDAVRQRMHKFADQPDEFEVRLILTRNPDGEMMISVEDDQSLSPDEHIDVAASYLIKAFGKLGPDKPENEVIGLMGIMRSGDGWFHGLGNLATDASKLLLLRNFENTIQWLMGTFTFPFKGFEYVRYLKSCSFRNRLFKENKNG